MAKVIVTSLNAKPEKTGRATVSEKRVRDADGQVMTLRTLDAKSSTFGTDLKYVFGRNVAKARRDNKAAIGTADIVVKR